MYSCQHENCQATFKQKSHLTRHSAVHTNMKKFTCVFEGCDARFNKKDCLNSHLESHKNERLYKCEICEQKFNTRSILKIHEAIHTDEKLYTCETCESSFRRLEHLKTHLLLHVNEKPFKCDECEFTTRQMTNLRSHQRVHTGEKPFKCGFGECDAAFAHKHVRDSHYYYNHTEEGASERKREEMIVKRFLDEKLPNSYIREMHVDYTCINQPGLKNKFSRIDFVLPHLIPNTIILLEVDENQHKHYDQSCEHARMHDIVSSLRLGGNTANVVFVRYNPHEFTINDNKVKICRKERLEKLVETMKKLSPDGPPFQVKYLFYDSVVGNGTTLEGKQTGDDESEAHVLEGICKAFTHYKKSG